MTKGKQGTKQQRKQLGTKIAKLVSHTRPPKQKGKQSTANLVSELGGRATGWMFNKIKNLTGMGDYEVTPFKVQNNSLMNAITANGPPSMHANQNRGVRVVHREYLGDLFTSSVAGAFQIQSFPIQPGNNRTFPWLSGMATLFQQWKLHGCVFEFKSTSADALNSTNTALGTVILATNYNSAQPAFINKIEMENTEFCSSMRQSRSTLHPIECKPSLSTLENLYIRSGANPPGTDIRMSDLGVFQIATQGSQGASVNIGELWISYDVEFLKPILEADESETDHGLFTNQALAYPMGPNNFPLTSTSNLGIIATSTGIQFPNAVPGDVYQVTCYVQGSVFAAPGDTSGAVSNGLSFVPILNGGPYLKATGTSNYANFIIAVVKVTATSVNSAFPPTLSFYFPAASPTGTGNGELIVTRLNRNYT